MIKIPREKKPLTRVLEMLVFGSEEKTMFSLDKLLPNRKKCLGGVFFYPGESSLGELFPLIVLEA